MHMIDAGRLAGEVRRGRGHVLGIGSALEPGEAKETEDLIADGEASTSAATASTTPDTSVPGIMGKANDGLVSPGMVVIPPRTYQSGGLMPTACTRTSTSPGFGSGTGASS
jgi:hypothetical protein